MGFLLMIKMMGLKRIAVVGLGVFCLGLASPVFAGSASKTVRISCTVAPRIELSAQSVHAAQPVLGNSDLSTLYDVSEELRSTPSGKIRLFSVAAL